MAAVMHKVITLGFYVHWPHLQWHTHNCSVNACAITPGLRSPAGDFQYDYQCWMQIKRIGVGWGRAVGGASPCRLRALLKAEGWIEEIRWVAPWSMQDGLEARSPCRKETSLVPIKEVGNSFSISPQPFARSVLLGRSKRPQGLTMTEWCCQDAVTRSIAHLWDRTRPYRATSSFQCPSN